MKVFWKILAIIPLVLLLANSLTAKADSGTQTATVTLIVPIVTTVSCTGSSATVSAGSQTNTLTVHCTETGNGNVTNNTGNVNYFTWPATLSDGGGHTLNTTIVDAVTSPDSTVTIATHSTSGQNELYTTNGSETALSAGGDWEVQSTATAPTTATTFPATYTGTITFHYNNI